MENTRKNGETKKTQLFSFVQFFTGKKQENEPKETFVVLPFFPENFVLCAGKEGVGLARG